MPNETNYSNYSYSWNQEVQHSTSYYQYARTHNTNMHDLFYGTQTHKNTILSPNIYASYMSQYEAQNYIQDINKPNKSCALSNENEKNQHFESINNPNGISCDFYKPSCVKEIQDVTNMNCSYSYPSCSQMVHNENLVNEKFIKYPGKNIQSENYKNEFGEFSYGNCFQQDISSCETYPQKFQENDGTSYANCYIQTQTNNFEFGNNANVDVTDSESDIVVEESEEVVSDYSEDFEQVLNYTSCIICNSLQSNNHFHLISSNCPLTVSSQVTIFSKITEFINNLDSNKQYYMCNHCLGLINTIDQLQNKIELYKNELVKNFNKSINNDSEKIKCNHSINCNVCKMTFSLKKIYKRHLLCHKIRKNYLCELCGKCFLKYSKFKLHYRIHKIKNGNVVKKINAFCCKICKKPFRTKTNLKEHENYCTGKLPFKCKHTSCNKKFATSTKLKDHIKLKHEKKFTSICSICNIGFIKPSDYKSHMTTHSTEKKYNCTLCDKSYKTLSNLNFHMKYHSSKLPYLCNICNKGFMRKEYLESHVNLHNGVKNFACQICNKKFVSQKNLDSHTKYHDGNTKKKSCDICGKFMSSGLEDHIRSHNNLKEFQCNICQMKFNTKGALAKHKKRKHDNITT